MLSSSAWAAMDDPLPLVSPKPQQLARTGPDIAVGAKAVRVVVDAGVDAPTRAVVRGALERAGAASVEVVEAGTPGSAPVTVRVGATDTPDIAQALAALDAAPPADLGAEGYVIATGADTAILAGHDADGTFYAAQTFKQITSVAGIAGVKVVDWPNMPLRGTIEGFYGSPWTAAERLDQMAFYGDVKMNTYIYAPKDDPYHRDQWRVPYPPDKYAELAELVQAAAANHVKFTFALSPGVSICFTSESDWDALVAKLQAMYDLGVRAFSIPLDDISLSSWRCTSDQMVYGASSQTTQARAQVDLLNRIQREFIDTHPGAQPLQMVPTQYGDLSNTAYKQQLRTGGWNGGLDPRIVVMWTGTDVVPPAITIAQAQQAASPTVFGRKVFVWDNYPVNDYSQTAGRLLLAPYQKRDLGLSAYLNGIVGNPMNQAAASKVALFTIADFTWNDSAYDFNASWQQAARYLAGGDAATAQALLTFFDLNYYAPTFGTNPWLTQSPGLSAAIADFWAKWNAGQHADAIAGLRPAADAIAAAPAAIRAGVHDAGFLADAANWLDATALWGQALQRSLDVLQARVDGNVPQALSKLAEASALATQAAAIRSVPGENRFEGPVRIGDGVLDTFINTIGGATVTVSTSGTPSAFGQPVTFTATVTSMPGPNPLPVGDGGTVQFRNGNANLNAPVPVVDGKAQTTTSTLAVGNRSITAVFTPAAPFRGATSPALTQVVTRANTAITLTASAAAAVGRPVTFTAAVSAVAPGAGTPTGNVQFQIDGVNAGSQALSGGVARLTTSTLSVGTHRITANYAQTTNFAASTASIDVVVHVVADAGSDVSATVPATLALTLGAPATFGAFVPGVDRTYEASTTATVTSTAGDAQLSVDGGHLANGAFTLSEPLEITFSKSVWDAPASNDVSTIGIRQHIGANEPLRTGAYSKTLTFTLSTTTP